METEIIKGFKGFDRDLKCRDKQYKVGETFEENVVPETCEKGMHFCEHPFDVFSYYDPSTSRFCEVEGSDKISKGGDKVSCSKLKIKTEIGLNGLIQAGVKFILEKVKWSNENIATGNCSGASATGYKSGASASNGSVASAIGMLSKAKGDIGSFIVLTECEEIDCDYFIKDVKAAKVVGKTIKENTWYYLKNGKFTEVDYD